MCLLDFYITQILKSTTVSIECISWFIKVRMLLRFLKTFMHATFLVHITFLLCTDYDRASWLQWCCVLLVTRRGHVRTAVGDTNSSDWGLRCVFSPPGCHFRDGVTIWYNWSTKPLPLIFSKFCVNCNSF